MKYESSFRDGESLENFELCLLPGEVWLTTEPEMMTWLEAIEIAGAKSNLRLPHYADLIRAVESLSKDSRLGEQFSPLEDGEFWTIGSEGYEANQPFACCVQATHSSYDSHSLKTCLKWVRFIKRGKAETSFEIQKKKELRERWMHEVNLHRKVSDILDLDQVEIGTIHGQFQLESKSQIRKRLQ